MRNSRVLARRALGWAGLIAVTAGLALLLAPAPPPAAAATSGSAVTKQGPHMYNPATGQQFKNASTVTVDQTSSLTSQAVRVSWTGFTPSANLPYASATTDYPVMVAQCNGTSPTSPNQCYGATNSGVPQVSGQFGASNTAFAVTAPNGTGQTTMTIQTSLDNGFFRCDQHHPCSLVVVPAQGGDTFKSPPVCTDHSVDQFSALAQYAYNPTVSFGACSWDARIVIPLQFAPTAANCPVKNASFASIGSSILARAMARWQTGLCQGSQGITIQYTSAVGEQSAIADVLGRVDDVAFTTLPSSTTAAGKRTFTYAPVAVSAATVAYWVDDPATGQPAGGLRLDQRLVAKLLTQSYNFAGDGCVPVVTHQQGVGCDKGVNGNAASLWADPEFKHLNPGIQPVFGAGGPFQIPTVASGIGDLPYEVTHWITASPAGSSFMQGKPDPWGTHVNTYYKGAYPTTAFVCQDPYPIIAHRCNPVFPPDQVASRYQANNWSPEQDWEKDQFGNYPTLPPEAVGQRGLFAVLGQGDAAAYRFPVAALANAGGSYIQPTNAGMAAALAHMTTNPDGITQQVNLASGDKAAYPLTMVVYAMVPTSGVSHPVAASIARFLRYVAGPGQRQGSLPGQLPPGYLPLPPRLAAQTLKAATEVANQTGFHPGRGTGTGGGTGTGSGAGGNGAGAAGPPGSPSLPGGLAAAAGHRKGSGSLKLPPATRSPGAGTGITTVAISKPLSAGLTRFALPVLLIAGGAAALGGAASVAGSTGLAGRLRLGLSRLDWSRAPWSLITWRKHP